MWSLGEQKTTPEAVVLHMNLAAPLGRNGRPLGVAEALPLGLQLRQAGGGRQPEKVVYHVEAWQTESLVRNTRERRQIWEWNFGLAQSLQMTWVI